MNLSIEDISAVLTGMSVPERPVLVGIDGEAGSGKTTFALQLADCTAGTGHVVSLVYVDSFYKYAADRWTGPIEDQPVGHDLDWGRLRDQVLLPLRSGKRARYQPFDWPGDCLKGWTAVDPVGVIIVEGVFALRNELSDFYDLRVWFTCRPELRASRVLNCGDMTPKELERWMPGEEAYVSSHAPERKAHLVVDGEIGTPGEGEVDRVEAIRWSPPT